MTITTKRDDEFRDRMHALIESALPEDMQKRLKKHADDLVYEFSSGIEYWIKDELADVLSGYVQDMAQRSIDSLLAGNEAMFRRYLQCEKDGWTGRDREQHVIHGRLFEPDAMELRRKLCQAFPDLLQTERLLDLEAQVAGLVAEVNTREAEIERLRERLR